MGRDLIDRQVAIEGVKKSCLGVENVVQAEANAIEYIKRMPSAQPERYWIDSEGNISELPSAQPEIIRCKDCKHYYFAGNRVPEEQSWVCDVWHVNQTAHMGYCFKAERRSDE